jgi:ABC-2 type transport system permease protein
MNNLLDMIWIESRKAIRSKIPLWTAIGSLAMPLGISFLLFVAKNPDISQKLGIVSAKSNLVAYASADWSIYLGLFGQMVAAGGLILSVLIQTWVFGREFADGTVKDILAVPVNRSSILLAKYIVASIWSFLLITIILLATVVMGFLLRLPGDPIGSIAQGAAMGIIVGCLVIISATPMAFFASVGRGYLLPVGITFLLLLLANLIAVIGWGEYFPWGIPSLFAQDRNSLNLISYVIVLLTGLIGIFATDFWWKHADQNR